LSWSAFKDSTVVALETILIDTFAYEAQPIGKRFQLQANICKPLMSLGKGFGPTLAISYRPQTKISADHYFIGCIFPI
jgi:hypothetical protein